MHTKRFDHTIKDKHEKIHSETIDDSGSSKCSYSDHEVIDGSGSSIGSERQVDVMARGESDKNKYSDTHINGTKSISASARRTNSSSSSESSSDDFFRMDALKFPTSGASTSKSGKEYVSSSGSSAKSEVDNSLPVPTSKFQVYDVTQHQKGMSPIVSPPVQVMERSGGYDPSRIPSSVFERNMTSPLEWSIASNESLFSLHIGNNSFSREHMFGDLSMSRELNKSGELNLFSRTASIILEETDTARKSVDVENLQTTETPDKAFKLEERLSAEDQNEMKISHLAASCESSKISSLSYDSGNSVHSFAFPIKKRARPLSYCSNCSWACCYKWPTCCHMRPSCKCSNCGWAFCYCWNCSHTKSYDHASPIFSEAERISSVKTYVPRWQSYKQESEASSISTASSCNCFQSKHESEVTSNSSANCCNWFHCFYCHSCTWKPCCSGCKCCC